MTDFLMTLPENVRGVLIDMVNAEMKVGGKYDPFTGDNVCEALISAEDPQFSQLATCLRSGDPVRIAAAVTLICREYWFDYGCRHEREAAEEHVANKEPEEQPYHRQAWELTNQMFEQVSSALFANQAH
jgi:hypothetical protein